MDSTITSIPLIVVSIVGFAGLGRLAGARSAMLSVVLGLGIAGAVASVLTVFAVGLIREALLALLLWGFLSLLWPLRRQPLAKLRALAGAGGRLRAVLGLVSLSISAALLAFLEAHIYNYESHDVLYFTPTLEMLIGDYLSPIRIFTYYPNEMASTHFLPSAVLAAALALVRHPDIALAIQARYLLSAFVLGALLYRIVSQGTGRQRALSLIFFIAALYVYGEEISYDLMISSFFYVYLIFCIGAFLLEPERESATARAVTWSLLIVAKAPIFFVAAVPAAFFAWQRRREVRLAVLAPIAVLVLANIASWKVLPPPNGDLSPGLFNIFSAHDFVGNMFEFYRWTLEEPIVRLLRSIALVSDNGVLELLSVVSLALYLLIKIYAIPLALVLRLDRWGKGIAKRALASFRVRSVDEKAVCLYFVTSIFAWLVIRFGGSVAYTIHAVFVAAILSAVIVGMYLIRERRTLIPTLVVVLAAAFAVPTFRHCPTCLPHWHLWDQRTSGLKFSLRLRDVARPAPGRPHQRYLPDAGETMLEAELRAALRGERLYAEDAPAPPAGQIARWYRQSAPSGSSKN